MPPGGLDPNATSIELQNGNKLSADLVIPAVGQTPNTQFLSTLPASAEDSLINPTNGFIRVRPTLQFADEKYPNFFAAGDVADSGAHKAARPGAAQAQVLARNILSMIEGKAPSENIVVSPPAIHLTLGLVRASLPAPGLLIVENRMLTPSYPRPDQESGVQESQPCRGTD
jgi:apoptosis-inducing factor 2